MRIVKIIIPCLLLNACIFGTSKNAEFYTLTPTDTPALSADYVTFVGVNRVQLPKYVERPQIVVQRKNSTQVNISEYHRWVESLSILATRVLTEDLSVLLPSAQIKQNRYKGEEFDRTVTVEIVNMDAVLGEKAEITAWYVVKDKADKVQIRNKFKRDVPVGKTYDELVQGYSQLLAELSQEIAQRLIQK
ncbi:PqiC family protein [Candidatus Avelusimicrobium luingense]|uniref:PqiC family protein n=1 Tax=Candidatus Avelusimicrobium luingense TaxID=3416211 RepID=UPI003D0E4291